MLYKKYLETMPLKDDPNDCPFCHTRPKRIFKKNKNSYLTYSLAPYHKHHLLVIPKRHVTSLLKLKTRDQRYFLTL